MVLFAQFLVRIYYEIPNSKIANFSTLKILQSSHFFNLRMFFQPKLEKIFLVPADSFDNVKGQFPIGFFVWNGEKNDKFDTIDANVFDANGKELGLKKLYSYDGSDYFSVWVNSFKIKTGLHLGWLQGVTRNDFQNQNGITLRNKREQIAVPRGIDIYDENLSNSCICFAVRMCIEATWLNDRDQFLYPNDGWQTDTEFQNDCFAFTLFSNNIQSKYGTNHWIPFTEQEVNSREKFESSFMSQYIQGKIKTASGADLFASQTQRNTSLHFSETAAEVFNAGKALWIYYHQQPNANVNASLYDIREHFQGRNDKGKMNNKSNDENYTKLIGTLRERLKLLAGKIEPKVYQYGFLKE